MKETRTQLRKGRAIPHCAAVEPQSTILTRPSLRFPRAYRSRFLVLLIEPGLEWREVVDDGGRIHLIFAGHCLQRFRPGLA
jgi:hypothetical protein